LVILLFVPGVANRFPVRKATSTDPGPAPVLKPRIKLK
jgi:hypothetical protein